MSGTAVVVLSDPKSGGEEALGRLFNAIALTLALKDRGEEVGLIFQGAGSRWPAEVTQFGHPANELYQLVRDKVIGVSGGCADVFGATQGAEASHLPLIRDRAIPGTAGILDLSRYLAQGWRLVTF